MEDSSFGATCSKIGETLPADYIEQRKEEGLGEYISPDMQIDASTCLFPETTWIVKNVHHDDFDRCCKDLAEKFLLGTNVTVENSGYSRFRVNDYATLKVSEMTEENCSDLDFVKIPEAEPSLASRIMSLIRLITVILRLLTEILNGTV